MDCVSANTAVLMYILCCSALASIGPAPAQDGTKENKKSTYLLYSLKKCLNIGSLIYHTAGEQRNRIRRHIIMAQHERESVKLKTHHFLARHPPCHPCAFICEIDSMRCRVLHAACRRQPLNTWKISVHAD